MLVHHRPARTAAVAFLFAALLLHPARAAIVCVSPSGNDGADGTTWATAKRTIQAGIAAAASSPTGQVWVAQGTYTERITLPDDVRVIGGFRGDETSARDRSLDASLTVIDGNGGGSVVTVPTGVTSASLLDTLTIRNGTGTAGIGSLRYGGGILMGNASPVIRNCVITGNTALGPSSQGGGIYITGATADPAAIVPTIANCVITGNTAGERGGGIYTEFASPNLTGNTITGNSAKLGGGFAAGFSGTPFFTDNTFEANHAHFGGAGYITADGVSLVDNVFRGNDATSTLLNDGYGGALFVYFVATPTVVRNTYYGNHANYGGALAIRQASPKVLSSVFLHNAADVEGGAVWVNGDYPNPTYTARPLVANNTLAGNTAPAGGGMHFSLRSAPRIVNNIVAFNSSGLTQATNAVASVNNNDVFGNNGADYTGLAAGANDISADPLFYNQAADNVRLTSGSPCVDRGDNSAVGANEVDRDGAARIQAGTVDLGAYETPAKTAFAAGDVETALKCAGGLASASLEQSIRLNVSIDGPSAGRIDAMDAALLMRKVAGLEANP